MSKRILLLGVYGSEVLGCGGALAINVRNGGESYASVMLTSDQSQKDIKRAADILGIKKVFFNNFGKGAVDFSYEKKIELCKVIREVKPDVIITQDPEHVWHDLDPDRRPAMLLLLEGIALAGRDFGLDEMPELEPHPIPKIYYMWPENPNCVVNIADVWDIREKAMDELAYQMEFSGKHFEQKLSVKELSVLAPDFEQMDSYYKKGRIMHSLIDRATRMYYGIGGHGSFALAEPYRYEGRFELEELD